MSLDSEKLRSIRQLPNVIRALLRSKKNRITQAWKHELYYALKHYPWQTDDVSVNGYDDSDASHPTPEQIDDTIKWLCEWVDGQIPLKKTKKKVKKKRK